MIQTFSVKTSTQTEFIDVTRSVREAVKKTGKLPLNGTRKIKTASNQSTTTLIVEMTKYGTSLPIKNSALLTVAL